MLGQYRTARIAGLHQYRTPHRTIPNIIEHTEHSIGAYQTPHRTIPGRRREWSQSGCRELAARLRWVRRGHVLRDAPTARASALTRLHE
eukprot:490239-Rhodomonas_salina.1